MFYFNENNLTFEDVIYDEIKKGNIQIKAETLDNLLQAIEKENKLTIKDLTQVSMKVIKKDLTQVSMKVSKKDTMTTVSFKIT